MDTLISYFSELEKRPLERAGFFIAGMILLWVVEKKVIPTSMMDISDGLSSELLHICESSVVGCVIYEDKLPISEDSRNAAYKFEIDPTACALSGGEDYELLFTIKQDDYEKLTLIEKISVIGYITEAEEGAKIKTKGGNTYNITAQGWNAFKEG